MACENSEEDGETTSWNDKLALTVLPARDKRGSEDDDDVVVVVDGDDDDDGDDGDDDDDDDDDDNDDEEYAHRRGTRSANDEASFQYERTESRTQTR